MHSKPWMSRHAADHPCHGQKGNRPIVIIAHSLGGLVAAQLFVDGEKGTDDSNAKAVVKHIRGLIFLGTPFRGSLLAGPAESARKILKLLGVETQEHTLKMLGVDSETLNNLARDLTDLVNKRRMTKKAEDQISASFFYETLTTRVTGFKYAQVSQGGPAVDDGSRFTDDYYPRRWSRATRPS